MVFYDPLSEKFVSEPQNLQRLQAQKCERFDTNGSPALHYKSNVFPHFSNFGTMSQDSEKAKVVRANDDIKTSVKVSKTDLSKTNNVIKTKLNPEAKAFVVKPIE